MLFLLRKIIKHNFLLHSLRHSNFETKFLFRIITEPTFPISSRSISVTPKYSTKLYVETENVHAYQTVRKLRNEDLPVSNNYQDVIKKFADLTNYSKENDICISNSLCDKVIDDILRQCRQLSDDEIYFLLQLLAEWPQTDSINSKNFGDLWSALDDMCLERHREWSIDKVLLFCELWYKLHLGRVSDFMKNALERIGRKPSKLSPRQIVQIMFYVNVVRRPLLNMFDFEEEISKYCSDWSTSEIGIISMAYFKTETKIKDVNILIKFMDKIKQEIDSINEISLCTILKIIRYSSRLQITDQIYDLLGRLCDQIDRLSLLSCVHISLLGTNSSAFHPKCLSIIANKLVDNIDSARLKDIERIMFAMSLFNFTPPSTKANFYELLQSELRKRTAEIEKYPRCLVSCLHYLSIMQVYSVDLIEKVFDAAFIKETYGRNLVGRELYQLSISLKIDVPNYTGPTLSDKQLSLLANRYTHFPPEKGYKLNATDKIFLDIKECIEDVLKCDVCFLHVVPSFERSDIIFGINVTNKTPVRDVKHLFAQYYKLKDVKYAPKQINDADVEINTIKWFAVVIGGWNNIIPNSHMPLGALEMKLRHLNKIGYEPILIIWKEWMKLSYSSKINFLQNKINTFI